MSSLISKVIRALFFRQLFMSSLISKVIIVLFLRQLFMSSLVSKVILVLFLRHLFMSSLISKVNHTHPGSSSFFSRATNVTDSSREIEQAILQLLVHQNKVERVEYSIGQSNHLRKKDVKKRRCQEEKDRKIFRNQLRKTNNIKSHLVFRKKKLV